MSELGKRSRSIKNINERLQQFAIEDIPQGLKKDRSSTSIPPLSLQNNLQADSTRNGGIQSSLSEQQKPLQVQLLLQSILKQDQPPQEEKYHKQEEFKQQLQQQHETEDYVKLISRDGREFVVPVRILKHSPTFQRMLNSQMRESKMVFSQ